MVDGSTACCSRNSRDSCSGSSVSRIIIRHHSQNQNSTSSSTISSNQDNGSSSMGGYDKEWREGRIVSLMRASPLIESAAARIYIQASAHLAFDHFNRRRGDVLSFLPDRLSNCDFYWSWKLIDSMASPIHAATELVDEFQRQPSHGEKDNNDEHCPPFAVLGGLASTVTQILATIGNGYQVPTLSPVSGASYLDGLPLLARMNPTSFGSVFATYLDFLNVSHVALLFNKYDGGGSSSYKWSMTLELQQGGIKVLSLPISENDMEHAMQKLAASGYKYVIYFHFGIDKFRLFRLAYKYGVMGHPGYTWIVSGGDTAGLLSPRFKVPRNDSDLANAMHGVAIVGVDPPNNQQFQQQLSMIAANTSIQRQFFHHYKQPGRFENYTFPPPFPTIFAQYAYDSVMAMGIAACETPGLFTGQQLYQSLLQTQFEGVSGFVSFDPETQTRSISDITYAVRNIVISQRRSTTTHFYFSNQLASTVDMRNNSVHQMQPFIYADNTTEQPLSLPALVQEQNLVPQVANIFGLLFGGLLLFTSVGWIAWTFIYRNSSLVRASQPIFLYQLCIGTFIMGLSVIPLSIQEPTPKHRLDMACMTIPWLISIGFVTSFSALFSKTWRLNQLFRCGVALRKITVQPKDVIWPFCALFIINIALLLSWTLAAPLQWHRVEVSNYDTFGRSLESFGDCNFASGLPFMIPLLVINFVEVLFAAYQSWKARHLSVELSESFYLAMSMASICETVVVAIPVLIAASVNTTASYLLRSSFVCVLSFTILLPIFVPKYLTKGRMNKSNRKSFRISKTSHKYAFHGMQLPIQPDESSLHLGTTNHSPALTIETPERLDQRTSDIQSGPIMSSRSDPTRMSGCAGVMQHKTGVLMIRRT